MSEVTVSLPVTARFDGCFCDRTCEKFRSDEDEIAYCSLYEEYLGCPAEDVSYNFHRNIEDLDSEPNEIWRASIRTRDCCRTFGIGPFEVTKEVYNIKLGMHQITYKMDGNLCAPDCPELVDGMCFRCYPEDLPILQKIGDRYERDQTCINDFGMGCELLLKEK